MTECIEWQGPKHNMGYGRVGIKLAHRHVYEECYGQIPEGLTLHHTCKNKLCVNPEHLHCIRLDEHNGGLGHGKLTLDIVRQIKDMLADGAKAVDLAREYDISQQQICNIRKGRCWASA